MDLTELYAEHKGFIEGCANTVASKYGCRKMLEDLVSVGTVAFLEHIGGYDKTQGATVITFLYPHIMGAMRREAEKSISLFSLSRREFEQMRRDGTIALAQGVSLEGHADEDAGGLRESIPDTHTSVEQTVYIRICLEHLRTAFSELSFKEREILGGFYGVYGYKEQNLAEIGEAFQIKENSARKAKDKALEKLRKLCLDGGLGRWRSIRAAIREARRECVVGRGDLGRYIIPEGCSEIE